MIKDSVKAKLAVMDRELAALGDAADAASQIRRAQLLRDEEELLQACRDCTPEDRVYLARHAGRPGTADFIQALFTDFFECKGDRLCREDPSILGGVALLPRTSGHGPGPPEGRKIWRRTWPATSACPARRATERPSV